ncbi:MAG TPA: plasmid pRiA4b ORF-3 family protein, partial [Propionibacteriaceae bacterium]
MVTLAGSSPSIWRRLDLANDLTLVEVHRVLQAAFDWYDGHLHQFVTDGPFPERFIDARMNAGPHATPEDDVRLDEVLAGPGEQLLYEYDFGDSWEHLLEVDSEHTRPVDAPRARVLDAGRAAPPEDCGGIFRYEYLVQHLDDPEVVEEIPSTFRKTP